MTYTLTSLELKEIMGLPYPNKTYQRRLQYRPSLVEVQHTFCQLNKHIFGNSLVLPEIELAPRRINYWGMCTGEHYVQSTGSYCKIDLIDKWFCPQWMVMILAHEMCHQYQWDILGPERLLKRKSKILSHGPSFFLMRSRLLDFGIPLKKTYSSEFWIKNQNLFQT